ncbi:YopX family protein [Staphylococcus simulans]|uniref:YopX family protein n=1 Tax=Staphylococcus simulans TaxID=1286 RepID=UPI000708AC9A|nr:YopX family protein [Staphylococcus simulans]
MKIKFRVWDKSEKKMKRVYSIGFNEQGEAISIQDEFADNYEAYAMYDVNDYELMQSTGLKDKNGTEIYEGDIVEVLVEDEEPKIMKDKTYIGIVVYKRGMFDIKNSKNTYLGIVPQMYMSDIDCVFEVLGNKYQNTELLEDKNLLSEEEIE